MSFFARSRVRYRKLSAAESLESRDLLAFNPTPMEQAMLEHTNRMRLDPQAELGILFESLSPLIASDIDVQRAIEFFAVSSSVLQAQWAELTPVPPLAWNGTLHDTALAHNELMIVHDLQQHVLPGEDDIGTRIVNAGYDFIRASENIYAYSESELYGHAGFVVDWGSTPSGIQDPPGHRDNIMDANLEEVGIAVTTEFDDFTDVGPLLITQDFGQRANYRPQLLGVVWEDGFTNGYYDAGEGYGSVQITIKNDQNTYLTSTLLAGGYQIEVEPGTYEVIAADSFLGTYAWGNIEFSDQNVKVDFELSSANRPPSAGDDQFDSVAGQAKELEILENDSDSDGSIDPTTVVITEAPQYGSLSIDAVTGLVTFTAAQNNPGSDTFRYLVRDDDGASSEALVSITIETPIPDFNDDGRLTCADVDALVADIAAGSHTAQFDITSDGVVDHADLDAWLATAGGLAGGVPFAPGDANLDGVVDGTDFTIWNENRYTNVAAWCAGDWSADGAVDGTDFNIWNEHKFVLAEGVRGESPVTGLAPRHERDPATPRAPLPALPDSGSPTQPSRFLNQAAASQAPPFLPSTPNHEAIPNRLAIRFVTRTPSTNQQLAASLPAETSETTLATHRLVDELFARLRQRLT